MQDWIWTTTVIPWELPINTNFEWTIKQRKCGCRLISVLEKPSGSEAFFPADHTMFVNAISAGFMTWVIHTKQGKKYCDRWQIKF
jgi:hypothetical protein